MPRGIPKNKEVKIEAGVEEEQAPVIESYPKWIKVTPEELQKLQEDKRLMGWNPTTGEAKINSGGK